MTPEYDPNQKIDETLKRDGEFLRDVDEGHTSTETGLQADLGFVREEHAAVLEEMQGVIDAANPPATAPQTELPPLEPPPVSPAAPTTDTLPPPAAPNQELPPLAAEHAQTMDSLAGAAVPEPSAPADLPGTFAGFLERAAQAARQTEAEPVTSDMRAAMREFEDFGLGGQPVFPEDREQEGAQREAGFRTAQLEYLQRDLEHKRLMTEMLIEHTRQIELLIRALDKNRY